MLKEYFGAGMLTGLEIERRVQTGDIEIDPFDKSRINPNSYNLRLDKKLVMYDSESYVKEGNLLIPIYHKDFNLDSHNENPTISFEIPDDGYVLQPGILYIGRTIERTKTNKFIPMINGRSSGGRLGLSVHICAGFGDIGFDGTWTLEITVVHPLKIYPGDEIAQVCFFTPYGDYDYQYKGRYQGQIDATPSKFYAAKTNESLVYESLKVRNHNDIVTALRMKYGFQEFVNQNIDLSVADIDFELRDNETITEDGFINLLMRSEDETYIFGIATIGKVYELEGVKVYVRRKANKNNL